jgi:hypothetical protein
MILALLVGVALGSVAYVVKKHLTAAQLEADLKAAEAKVAPAVAKVKADVLAELAKVEASASADVKALVAKIKSLL